VPNQPLLSCEVDLSPHNDDFVPDKVVTIDVSGPSAVAVTPMDVLMHSVKYIGIIYEANIAIHMRH